MKKLFVILMLLFISACCMFAQEDAYPDYKLDILKAWAKDLGNTEDFPSKHGYMYYILNENFITESVMRQYYCDNYEAFVHPEFKNVFFIFANPGEKKKLDALFNELKSIKDINKYYKKAKELISKKYKSFTIFDGTGNTNDFYDLPSQLRKGIAKLNKGDHSAVGVITATNESYILGCLDVAPASNISFEDAQDEIFVALTLDVPYSDKFKIAYEKEAAKNQKPDKDGFVIYNGELLSYTGNAENVEIPREVRRICSNAFSKKDSHGNLINNRVKSIICYDNLRVLEDYAFFGLENLSEIMLPKTLEECSGLSFMCPNLEKIILLGKCENYYTKDSILYDKFNYIVFYPPAKNAVKLLDEKAEYDGCFACNRCEEYLPKYNHPTNIPSFFLANASNLKRVKVSINNKEDKYLNKCFSDIKKGAFLNCINLEVCEFDSSFYDMDLNFAAIRILEDAFENCINLQKINFDEYVDTISDTAFMGCINLREVYFNQGVKYISDNTFKDCKELEKVYILNPKNDVLIEDNAFKGQKYLTIYTNDSSVYGWCKSHNVKVEIVENK